MKRFVAKSSLTTLSAHSQNKGFTWELSNGLKVAVRFQIAMLIPNGYLKIREA
jgi:hypothetical protein